jgi:hypothetical protein
LTKASPAAVLFGREFNQPGDSAVFSYLPPLFTADKDEVMNNMEKMSAKNKKMYDKHCSPQETYQPGELVLLKDFAKSDAQKKRCKRMEKKFKGPYTIINRLIPLNYQIRSAEKSNDSDDFIVHCEQIKKYKT